MSTPSPGRVDEPTTGEMLPPPPGLGPLGSTPSVPWVCAAIVIVLVLAFLGEVALGDWSLDPSGGVLLALGAGFGPALLAGEWWRLLSATVLHAGVVHLLVNVWALLVSGLFAERVFGRAGFLAIYLLSGIGASLMSAAIAPTVISVGASGAIFGVYGALLAFTLTHRGVIPMEALLEQRNSILGFLLYNTVNALGNSGIDMGAHAGGFVTGAVAGLFVSRDLLQPTLHARRRVLGVLGIGALLAASAPELLKRLESNPEAFSVFLMLRAEQHVLAGEYQEALSDATAVLEGDPGSAEARGLRIAALVGLERYPEAELDCEVSLSSERMKQATYGTFFFCTQLAAMRGDLELALDRVRSGHAFFPDDLELLLVESGVQDDLGRPRVVAALLDRALQIDPTNPLVLNNRAWQRIEDGDFLGARQDADRALLQTPDDSSILDTRCFALFALGEVDAARADCTRALALRPKSRIDEGMLAMIDGRHADAIDAWTEVGSSDPSLARQLAPWVERAKAN